MLHKPFFALLLLAGACPGSHENQVVKSSTACPSACDLFERCAPFPQGFSECVITCDFDSDCSSSCCAPYEGGGLVCAPNSSWCGSGAGGGSGGGSTASGGGGATSSGGACAFYSDALGRAVCEPGSSASGCSGTFLGEGTMCAGFTCTSSSNPSTCSVPGGGGTGGGAGSGGDCSGAWTCAYDGQASPMCQAACAYSGQQRTFTCQQVVNLVGASLASSCCSVCR